jgi:uncharacterized protein (TIGR02996 family)
VRNAEIEAAILAAPDDPSAYLVYADWLQSHGDPRGELITLQHAMRAQTDPSEFARFKRHEEALRLEHGAGWLGDVIARAPHRTFFEWRLGFVDTARFDDVHSDLVAIGDSPTNPYAITRSSEPSLVELVTALFDSPCGWLVRHVALRGELPSIQAALRPLPGRVGRRLALTVWSTDPNTAKRVLAPEIMRMLNANVDVELVARSTTERFAWVRPKPSKRRT